MTAATYTRSIIVPTVEQFTHRYPWCSRNADAWRAILDRLWTAECFVAAEVVTDLELPAVAGIARYLVAEAEANAIEWSDALRKFIGAALAMRMLANGYRTTGRKRYVPHPAFTKGEVYRRASHTV